MYRTLLPPLFNIYGEDSSIDDAQSKGLWLVSVNLWIVSRLADGQYGIVFQRRSLTRKWSPGKLDVSVGGKVNEGDSLEETVIKESKEELGIDLGLENINYIGKTLGVSIIKGKYFQSVPHIFLAFLNITLDSYKLCKDEVDSIYCISMSDLLKLFSNEVKEFKVKGLDLNKRKVEYTVTLNSFTESWDNYNFRMIKLIESYLKGEKRIY